MHNYKKSLAISMGVVLACGGTLWAYSNLQSTHFHAWKSHQGSNPTAITAKTAPNRERLLSQDGVLGGPRDAKLKESIEHLLAGGKLPAAHERLKTYFPDSSPMGFWIRAAIAFGTVSPDAEITPENFALIGMAYSQILNGEESSVASLAAGLQALPRTETAFRQQAFRMLSDIGMKDRRMREAVKSALLSEAARAADSSDGALAFASLLRMNPTKEGLQEVSRSYEKLHPGSEFSDFVALNVANL